MPKYWGKNYFAHVSFLEVGQKQQTEKKERRERERKFVITMASYALQTPPRFWFGTVSGNLLYYDFKNSLPLSSICSICCNSLSLNSSYSNSGVGSFPKNEGTLYFPKIEGTLFCHITCFPFFPSLNMNQWKEYRNIPNMIILVIILYNRLIILLH